MSTTAQVEGYKNFEDCDECGFVARKPPDQPATNPLTNPLHAAIDIADGQRSLGRRLDELLEEPGDLVAECQRRTPSTSR